MLKQGTSPSERLPEHVAIIMDGNGRWAQKNKLPRIQGHVEGVNRVEEISAVAAKMGIKVLTLYVFSTENWQRPKQEVAMLMKLLCSALEKKLDKLLKENVRFHVIGQREGVPPEVLKILDAALAKTKDNSGMVLNLAFNYGSRAEILDAVRQIALDVHEGRAKAEEIDEEYFSRKLYTRDLPDPDLLIRTSGEQRISNFLLWQLSYAELYFTPKFWPEFNEKEFRRAISDFQQRDRRYGKVDHITMGGQA